MRLLPHCAPLPIPSKCPSLCLHLLCLRLCSALFVSLFAFFSGSSIFDRCGSETISRYKLLISSSYFLRSNNLASWLPSSTLPQLPPVCATAAAHKQPLTHTHTTHTHAEQCVFVCVCEVGSDATCAVFGVPALIFALNKNFSFFELETFVGKRVKCFDCYCCCCCLHLKVAQILLQVP